MLKMSSEPDQDTNLKMPDNTPGNDSENAIELDDDGVDGELVEGEEEEMEKEVTKKKSDVKRSDKSNHSDKDSSSYSPRKRHGSSEHRKHHHHHSSSDNRKRRKSHSGEEGDDADRGRRSHKRSNSTVDGHSDRGSNHRRSRSRDRNRSKHHSSRSQRRSNEKSSKEEDHNDAVEESGNSSRAKKTHKEHKKEPIDKAEAEDGEILEEGELSDDDDEAEQEPVTDTSREEIRESPVKSSRKDDKKDKSSRDHRKKDDDKKKQKKYVDVDKVEEDEEYAAPAWGSGYQGAKKPKTAAPAQNPSFGKSSKGSKSSKGHASPPGLYDSPSYSEDSDSEPVTKPFGMMPKGYVDASVAADEKEGIFKRNVPSKRKKKNRPDRPQGKRKNADFNKSDGPPAKKSAMERPVCKFYRDGKCAKGSGCTFNHDVEQNKRMEVCKYHLTVKGCHKEKCLYMHDFPCKYYHTGTQCFSGENCKFSHDALTDATRRALEMRVDADDIIDMEDSDYEYDYDNRHRGYESRSRPSLLGSPPRRHDLKKIPSLFEIETHPPGKSPKPSPQPPRPTGFYSETNQSPNPGGGANKGGGNGPQLSPNPGNNINNNTMNNNQPAGGIGLLGPGAMTRPNLNGPIGGGLLRTPGNMPLGPAIMGNRAPFNGGNQPAPSNPVLNMLGAIIREAAIQKVAPVMMNAMASISNMNNNNNNNPISSMAQNMNNMGGNVMGPNGGMFRMGQGNQMGPNMMMNRMNTPNSMNNNMNNVPSMGLSTMASGGMEGGNPGQLPENQEMNPGMEGQEDMMDVDYRIKGPQFNNESTTNNNKPSFEDTDVKSGIDDSDLKGNFDENEDNRRELSELDQIRRHIQEQIDNEEDEENEDEDEGKLAVDTEKDGLSPEREEPKEESNDQLEKEPMKDDLLNSIEVPAHLPKMQRELFMRIQQQHLLREKQKEQQDAGKVVEQAEITMEKDDWYSDSDEEGGETQPNTNPESSTGVVSTTSSQSSSASSSINPLASITTPVSLNSGSNTDTSQSSTSTINIMQMINAIRKQTSTSTTNAGDHSPSASESKRDDHSVEMASPASPPPEKPALDLKPLSVDPPIVSAMPKKPLPYSVVKIALDMPKIYSVLPSGVNPSDPTYRHDPRVKKHIQHFEKQLPPLPPMPKEKEPTRKLSSDEKDKPAKVLDPRLSKRSSGDPRLQPKQGTSPRAEEPRTDPRLKKEVSQPKVVDPRLAKRAQAAVMDPRLNRQMSQESVMGPGVPGVNMVMGGGPMGSPGNNMGGPMNPMVPAMNNQMNGGMGGPVRPFQGGGPMGNNLMRMNSTGNMGNMGPNHMGSPIIGRPQGNNMMGGPQNNMMGGPQGNIMSGPQGNMMGGPQANNMMSGPQGNLMGVPQGNNMMGVPQGNNMMGGPQGNNMMSGPQGNLMGVPQGNMMSGPQGNNMMSGPQGNMMGGPQGNMMGGPQGNMMGGPQGNMMSGPPGNMMGGPQGNMMGGSQGHVMGGPQESMVGTPGNMMGGPQGMIGSSQGNNVMGGPQGMMGGRGQMLNGPVDRINGPRGFPSSPNSFDVSNNERPGNDTNDPRLGSRASSDPRGIDPRLRNKVMDPRDQSKNDTTSSRGSLQPARDPREKPVGDPRNRQRGNAIQPRNNSPNFQMDSHSENTLATQKPGFSSLAPLSSSATLPPLPSLSPPQLSSFPPTSDHIPPQPPKDSDNENTKSVKKFDYRNDPRFKRVKRSAGQRKSSMDYSSPLGQEDNDQKMEEVSGSPQYNGYNRPKPGPPHRPNAPSPTLPDTLQDFDLPELPPHPEPEPDLKVKDLFKTFDPTASPFC